MRCCARLNSAVRLSSENYLGGSSETICITSDWMFTRDEQLLREECNWSCAPGTGLRAGRRVGDQSSGLKNPS